MKNNKQQENKVIAIDLKLINNAKTVQKFECQTIIHCNYTAPIKYENGGWININSTTFLVNENSRFKIKLVHVENIPIAPNRHFFLKAGEKIKFTLVFQGLPKTWSSFSLLEETLFGGGFHIYNIEKNKTGIYEININ
jgi:hypothetical protein